MVIDNEHDFADIRTVEFVREDSLAQRVMERLSESSYTHELTIVPTPIEDKLYSLSSLYHFIDAVIALTGVHDSKCIAFLVKGGVITRRMCVTQSDGISDSKIYYATARRTRDCGTDKRVIKFTMSQMASLHDTPVSPISLG